MGFNNGSERRKFDRMWKKLRVEYAAAGMDEAAIEEMYQFDLTVYRSNRRYAEHGLCATEQMFSDDGDIAGEDKSPLLKRYFDSLAVLPGDVDSYRRGSWVDEVESPRLACALRQLSDSDLELLTLYVFEGYSMTEIASMQGCSQQNVSQKIGRIKKFLKNF